MGAVRIIAGEFRGRRIAVPDEGTRPTSDRVREALFNIILARINLEDARILDLYAGSGALGLEALSRGAAVATFVESRRRAAGVIARNIATCGAQTRTTVRTGSVADILRGSPPREPFDLIMLDPPYGLDAGQVADDLAALSTQWLSDDGLVVVERSTRGTPVTWPPGLDVLVARDYGDTRVEVGERG